MTMQQLVLGLSHWDFFRHSCLAISHLFSRVHRLTRAEKSMPNGFMKFSATFISFCALFLLLTAGTATPAKAALSPANLRCDYAVNPLGVDAPNPRLFWTVASSQRSQKQTAYEILAASSPELLAQDKGDLWNSGKVATDETIQIPYAGRTLESSQPVFWKVRVWDANGNRSAWSCPAGWTMGILKPSDWNAKWIAGATNWETVLLRREFAVKPGLKRALIHVCGLGQYELSLNGNKAGDDLLTPGWTKYDRTCLYDTRDITLLLHQGRNAAGLLLGNGMYNVPTTRFKPPGYEPYSFGTLQAIAQLRLEYADGSLEIIGTDNQWDVAPGPITVSSIYGGEDFDARLVQPGWDEPAFDNYRWPPAKRVAGPGGDLKGLSCAAPPIRAFDVLKPVSARRLTNDATVYDLGQNAALMVRIRVRGPAGSQVRIIPAELLKADGSVDCGSSGGGQTWWQYTLAGKGSENYFPKFFYHGCRYLQVQCLPATEGGSLPVVKNIEGVVVHSASEPVGEFECSNPLYNRIRRLVRWAQRSNMMSVMTDCPQREKRGWLEEDHLNGPALRYEFDLAQLFTKMLNDIADSQLANGLVPTTAPEYAIFRDRGDTNHLRGIFGDSPEWSSAFILVPWQQYEFDGDLNLFRTHYDAMTNYLAYLGSRADNYIVNYGLGDWYDVGPKHPGISQLTPIALTGMAFYYQDAKIMSAAAALLGKDDDAKQFFELAEKIRAAFNEKFYDPTNRLYATGSQTANAIPLVMNLCDPTNRAAVLDAIVRDIRARGNALTAGDVGYRYLLLALAEGGRSDVIFDLNNQSDKPGYGFQLKKGATSLTEAWDAGRGSSQNHFMLGQIQEWFYHDVAGLGGDPAGPGFKKIIIRPQPAGDLTWARADYDSIRGKITSDWKHTGGKFALSVTIPANTTATVFIPAAAAETVTESGKPAAQSGGVKFLRMENDRAVFKIESGSYTFGSRF
jgi:hypothetical protein